MSIESNTNNREILINRLIISPNLDALLEQEDKTRARLKAITTVSEITPTTVSSRSVSPGEEFLVGLPPPPRHPRVKLPQSTTRAAKSSVTLDTEVHARETPAKPAKPAKPSKPPRPAKPAPTVIVESPLSNPFINTARPLADREPSNKRISELSSLRTESPSPILFSSPWGEDREVDVEPPIRKSSHRHRQQNSLADPHSKPWRLLHGNSHSKRSNAKRPSTSHGISSTREPAYTAKDQSSISVSSVYPPSDKDSYLYIDSVPSNSEKIHSRSQSTSTDCPQISPIQFTRKLSESLPSLYSNQSLDLPTLEPISDTTPLNSGISRPLPRPLPPIPTASSSVASLSLTTNYRDSGERAELVRKTRKLASVFGTTPGADVMQVKELSLPMSRYSSDSDWSRSPVSRFDEVRRRSSAPVSPDDISFISSQRSQSSNDQAGHHVLDTFDGGVTASEILEADSITRPLLGFPTQSELVSIFSEDEQAEERRRKREKLAKLHRFLGSRVPINLVLGTDIEPTLPSPYVNPISPLYRSGDIQTTWLKRRKSISAIPSSPHWANDLERVKEELNEQEKLINVRRAVKMEKVFGVAPPQTLYHTRHCPSPLLRANTLALSEGSSPIGSVQRVSKRSTYSKQKFKKDSRPSTGDSDLQLVPKTQTQETETVTSDDFVNPWGTSHSNIYTSYQYSLNSLQDILAWDDRESLVELHQYLNAEEVAPSSPGEVSSLAAGSRLSAASFFGRRRSLPVLSSRISLDSEYIASAPETSDDAGFQERRRKAAKLTQFFGVDYRELINDVLQSIEHGVKNEHKSGTLRAEEAEDLLARLRRLKIKRPKSQSFLFLD